ncbi:hypothetical protein ACSSS7_006743 [Eimeria intestinalis]
MVLPSTPAQRVVDKGPMKTLPHHHCAPLKAVSVPSKLAVMKSMRLIPLRRLKNRAELQHLMARIHGWRLSHWFNRHTVCFFDMRNICFRVEAVEVSKRGGWPRSSDIQRASVRLEEFILRTEDELIRQRDRHSGVTHVTNGFLIAQNSRQGNGRIEIFIDAWWRHASSVVSEDQEAEGAAGPSAGPPPQPQLPGIEGPHQLLEAPDPNAGPYEYPRIVDPRNRRALESLMQAFSDMRKRHTHVLKRESDSSKMKERGGYNQP